MAEVTFGEWLKRRRSTLGLTQIELAEQVHCSVSAIRKFETELRRPSDQIVAQLVKIFNISPEEQDPFLKFARGDWMAAPADTQDTPWRPSPKKHNLPIQLTSFIGREGEIKDVRRLLADTRILSLVGPGGTGKTRLSLQVAGDILQDYKAGTWLVEFAPVSNPALVPTVTASALKLPAEAQRPAIDMLCDYLRERQLLLLLDNCEHLVDACAQMADTLLRTCPDLHILVTSREALGIPGEVSYQVPPLRSPDVQHLPPVDSLTQYEAVKLFIDRAAAVLPDFQVTNDTAPAVAQVCHRLDGIPLAIELAAAKVSVLSVEEISARLDDRFRLLTGGSRTALAHHQTLRATIEWSYNLLSPPLQTLFQRLSVFVNGWSLEDAEMVCSDQLAVDGVRSEAVLDLLAQLVNKSLVIAETRPCESRYRMLETVRQYANDRLDEAGEVGTLRDRHLDHFLDLAETAEPHLRRAEQIVWLDRLECEHDNLRAALEWALRKPAAECSLRLAGALGPFWDIRDHWKEGFDWLQRALKKREDEASKKEKAARAKALYINAEMAVNLNDLTCKKESSEAAYRLCQDIGDRWGTAYSRSLIACAMSLLGSEFKLIKPLVEQSMRDFLELGDVWGLSEVLMTYALVLFREGKQKEFHETLQKRIALARESGDRKLIASGLLDYSGYLIELEEYVQSEKLNTEAVHLAAEVGCLSFVKIAHSFSAEILILRDEYKKARELLMDCYEFFCLIGEKFSHSRCLFLLALLANAEGDIQQAISYLQVGLDIRTEINHTFSIPLFATLLGYLYFRQGDFDLAKDKLFAGLESARNAPTLLYENIPSAITLGCSPFVETNPQAVVQILSATESLLQKQNMARDVIIGKLFYEQDLATARAKLGVEEFNASWEIGTRISLDNALDLALKLVEEM